LNTQENSRSELAKVIVTGTFAWVVVVFIVLVAYAICTHGSS
jgi:hypothetical protein